VVGVSSEPVELAPGDHARLALDQLVEVAHGVTVTETARPRRSLSTGCKYGTGRVSEDGPWTVVGHTTR
jgi:hypothetical protein